MTEPRIFDYIKRYDPRNANHLLLSTPVAQQDSLAGVKLPAHFERTRHVWLDQGTEGACTGFSSAQWLSDTPYVQRYVTNETGKVFYRWAQENDDWPGEAYSGSSLLGALQGMVAHGVINEYKWLVSSNDVAYALYKRGSVIMGSNWYSGMSTPDAYDGSVSVTGEILGGHCFKIGGYRSTNSGYQFRIDNSWGEDWGIRGSCWISASDFDALIAGGAEAASPRKVRPFNSELVPR